MFSLQDSAMEVLIAGGSAPMKREKLIGFPLAITRSATESRRKATL
jgi:hypothetical protein